MSRDDQPGEAQPPAGTATAASLRCYVTKDPYQSCNPSAGDHGHPQRGLSLRRLPPPWPSAEPWRQSRRTKSAVLTCAEKLAEQPGVAQQVHIPHVLLADVGMCGLPHPPRLVLVAE
jgi:hypothetical protein